jgi:hypothetical protein
MRKLVLAAVLTAGLAGCAGPDPGPGAAPATTPAAASPAPAEVFPLTVTRTGGFAGVDDRAEISADGTVVVTRGGQTPVRSSLPFVTVAELRRVLAAPDFPGRTAPSAGDPVCNDGFTYAFVSPAVTGTLQDCGAAEPGTPARALAIARDLFQG